MKRRTFIRAGAAALAGAAISPLLPATPAPQKTIGVDMANGSDYTDLTVVSIDRYGSRTIVHMGNGAWAIRAEFQPRAADGIRLGDRIRVAGLNTD